MLPNLNRLTLVSTGGMLGNAQWPEDEVCSICTYPLERPSEDERYEWPFSGDGTGFTAVACIQGHAFHKGCLRYMQRFHDTKCPDCRKPMFKEVLENVSRRSPEEVERAQQEEEEERQRRQREEEERQRRQREQRERAREERAREMWERERAGERALAEYEALQDTTDFAVQWTFFIKGHIPSEERIWNTVRVFFGHHMRAEWPNTYEPVENWERRLTIALLREEVAPIGATHASMRVRFTRCRFRMHLPEAAARRFAGWLTARIENRGYGEAMEEVVGMKGAVKAGPDNQVAVAVVPGYPLGVTGETENVLRVHATATPAMTWRDYQAWPEFGYSAAPAAPAAPAPIPIQQFGFEEAADMNDHSVQWAFFLKGHVPADQAIWDAIRAFFGRYMFREWAPRNPVADWGRRLRIRINHENDEPTNRSAQGNALAFTRCRFELHLPEAVAHRFAEWLVLTIGRWGYVSAMRHLLGIRVAIQAGQAVAVQAGMLGNDTEATISAVQSQENARLGMTWPEYQSWLPFQYQASTAGLLNAPAPAPAPAPARRAQDWMWEEAMEEERATDPI